MKTGAMNRRTCVWWAAGAIAAITAVYLLVMNRSQASPRPAACSATASVCSDSC